MKPFSEASEQNKLPILAVLCEQLVRADSVLEIGSGTGQHAVHFARQLPHLEWIATDVEENIPGILAWVSEAHLPNLRGPFRLDVNAAQWPVTQVDGVFSANTTHIMDWQSVENMYKGIGRVLSPGGVFCLYGPFNYDGAYISDSNVRFDLWLRQRDAASGIRDFNDLDRLARDNGMILTRDYEMPVNNRTLVWRKA
ncbi:MAG: DUF938 domain-containing protein [Pseudomonadota bacterium]|nr:MAG: DUF938 domain-containing protein [Pseudomonadota bacterium]